MKLNLDLIEQLVEFNKDYYDKALSVTINNNQNNNLTNITNYFKNTNNNFEVNKYNYQESLTSLTGSAFYNTLSVIIAFSSQELATIAKVELTSLNQRFKDIITNGFDSIDNAIENVYQTEDIFEFVNNIKLKIYEAFHETIKVNLGSKILPRLIDVYLNQYFQIEDQELLEKKLEILIEDVIIQINEKVLDITKISLNEIYRNYQLKDISQQNNNFHKKNRFADFDEEIELFNPNFDDEKIALKTLGLTSGASLKEIKLAYKQLAIKYHPDNNKSHQAETEMKKINIAYNLLKNREGN
ncbi:J domain-containing protein [[Acholeplasma] multilocale]|uniref:J domain-containing protein n=1 Tax=[Acholeplasma] multilocale TaxID=264638 RepID=UPI00041EE7A0|nr:DnaJ domain-containing protein [[Acholeplasma] multilocale]